MAYRRRQGITRASTFKEEVGYSSPPPDDMSSSSSSSSSLAAQAIRASSAHRDSSLSSAYGESAFASAYRSPDPHRPRSFRATQDSTTYEYTSMKNLKETKYGFWSVLARKAKSILDDDNLVQQFNKPDRTEPKMLDSPSGNQMPPSYLSPSDNSRKTSSPSLQKGLDAITSSLNYIGNAFEEGLTIVENRTADIVQETRKLHIRRKGNTSEIKPQAADFCSSGQQLQMQTDQETQLKASRDVAMAMAAKAKLLLRELKTVKADLAFAKERCAQLEEENRILRESRDKGVIPEDDDLIRLQLETLLAEKARLAHENSIYARENRFLREIVEYHQLTMQDVVYVDEGIEEVTEVCPISIPAARDTGHVANTQTPPSEISLLVSQAPIKDISVVPPPPPVMASIPSMAPSVSNGIPISSDRDMQLPAETSSMVSLPAMTDMSVVPLFPPVMASAPSLSPSVSGGAPISLDKNAQLSSTSSA